MGEIQEALKHSTKRIDHAHSFIEDVNKDVNGLEDRVDALNARVLQHTQDAERDMDRQKKELESKIYLREQAHEMLEEVHHRDVTRMSEKFTKLESENGTRDGRLAALEIGKVNTSDFAVATESVHDRLSTAEQALATLNDAVQRLGHDLKVHRQKSTSMISTHTTAIVTELRAAYQDEVKATQHLRDDLERDFAATRARMAELEESVARSQCAVEASLLQVTRDAEERMRGWVDRWSGSEKETSNLQAELERFRHSSEAIAACVEHLSTIMWMVLQSERAASALDVQDDSDRGQLALMGYATSKGENSLPVPGTGSTSARGKTCALGGRKTPTQIELGSGLSMLPPAPGAAASSEAAHVLSGGAGGLPARSGSRLGGGVPSASSRRSPTPDTKTSASDAPRRGPLNLDERCLSCCGEALPVTSCFKMACLEYAPSQVPFDSKSYDRPDLLKFRDRLLVQAQEALRNGPAVFSDLNKSTPHDLIPLSARGLLGREDWHPVSDSVRTPAASDARGRSASLSSRPRSVPHAGTPAQDAMSTSAVGTSARNGAGENTGSARPGSHSSIVSGTPTPEVLATPSFRPEGVPRPRSWSRAATPTPRTSLTSA